MTGVATLGVGLTASSCVTHRGPALLHLECHDGVRMTGLWHPDARRRLIQVLVTVLWRQALRLSASYNMASSGSSFFIGTLRQRRLMDVSIVGFRLPTSCPVTSNAPLHLIRDLHWRRDDARRKAWHRLASVISHGMAS